MAREQAIATDPQDVQPDILPDPDDDGPTGADPAPDYSGAKPTDEERAAPKQGDQPEPSRDVNRDEIAKRYREFRAQREGEADEAGDDTELQEAQKKALQRDLMGEVDEDEVGEPDATDDNQEPASQQQGDEDDPIRELVVDGQKVYKRRSEIYELAQVEDIPEDRAIALAQREIAANNRLEQANRALRDVRAQSQPDPQHQQAPDQTAAEPDQNAPDHTSLDQQKLKNIVERIQVGDESDGIAALSEFADLVKSTGSDPAQVEQTVQRYVAQQQQQDEVNAAVRQFGEENPDIVQDPDYATTTIQVAARTMRDDMLKLGLREEDLAPLGDDPQAIARAHRSLRLKGHPLRNYHEILSDTGKYVRGKFRLGDTPSTQQQRPSSQQPRRPSANPQSQQERVNAKKSAQPQPRHVGVREKAQEGKKPKSRQEIVAGMRKARGFG